MTWTVRAWSLVSSGRPTAFSTEAAALHYANGLVILAEAFTDDLRILITRDDVRLDGM